jgi:hypothetical protein
MKIYRYKDYKEYVVLLKTLGATILGSKPFKFNRARKYTIAGKEE